MSVLGKCRNQMCLRNTQYEMHGLRIAFGQGGVMGFPRLLQIDREVHMGLDVRFYRTGESI
jgi:hypothetical protein